MLFTHNSVLLSALVTYPSPCYDTDLLYQLADATDLPPMQTFCILTF
jgi:hypothetical protein